MAEQPLHAVVRHLRTLAAGPEAAEADDQELLRRLTTNQDEVAFAALVRRHGPMVRDVCRRLLGQEPDVDDAFQAIFLALARQAHAIRKRRSLAGWLYGVAYRTAERVRRDAARRRHGERRLPAAPPADPAQEASWRELCAILDMELHQLPETYQAPLLLCYLEGRTRDEAARQLGLSLRTLDRRLERGRELLRLRLVRRGLTPSAALLVAGMTRDATAGVPAALVALTTKAALWIGVGKAVPAGMISARAAALLQEVMKAMTMTKLKLAAVVLCVVAASGIGAGAFLRQGQAPDRTEAGQAQPPKPAAPNADRGGTPARPARADKGFETAPGYSWAREPSDGRGNFWAQGWNVFPPGGQGVPLGQASLLAFEETDKDGGLVMTLTLSYPEALGRPSPPDYRAVAFDAGRKRYPLKRLGGVGGANVLMFRFYLDPKVLPANKVKCLGVEWLTAEGRRVVSARAVERAKKRGVEVLPLPQVGEAYDFSLTALDGKKVRARDLRGKVVLIDCWATWCSPCVAQLPEIQQLYADWHGKGLEVVGISFDRDPEKVKKTCAALGLGWPQVVVPSDEQTRELWKEAAGIESVPRVLLVDREGVLRADSRPARLREEVARLLQRAPRGGK